MEPKNKKIVVIGGGTGTFTVLSGLKKYPVDLTAIVAMADDGGSTGVLREEFGILPPGSVRPALVALSHSEKSVSELFNFRFENGSFKGHNFGNVLITALAKMRGNFERAIDEAGKILNVKGKVVPSTLDNARLCAKLENGEKIIGETNIDVPKHNGNLKIVDLYFSPSCRANPRALKSILEANLIVIGPGDLFSSILPNLIIPEISMAFRESKARKVYVCNLMTKFGETTGFRAIDFVAILEKYLSENTLDYVILNNRWPSRGRILKYEKEKAELVKYDHRDFENKKFKIIEGDFLRPRGFIRHNPHKLGEAIFNLL